MCLKAADFSVQCCTMLRRDRRRVVRPADAMYTACVTCCFKPEEIVGGKPFTLAADQERKTTLAN